MPLYHYKCPNCTTEYDQFLKLADYKTPVPCHNCGHIGEKVITAQIQRDEPTWLNDEVRGCLQDTETEKPIEKPGRFITLNLCGDDLFPGPPACGAGYRCFIVSQFQELVVFGCAVWALVVVKWHITRPSSLLPGSQKQTAATSGGNHPHTAIENMAGT